MSFEQQKALAVKILQAVDRVRTAGYGEVVVKIHEGKVTMIDEKIQKHVSDVGIEQ